MLRNGLKLLELKDLNLKLFPIGNRISLHLFLLRLKDKSMKLTFSMAIMINSLLLLDGTKDLELILLFYFQIKKIPKNFTVEVEQMMDTLLMDLFWLLKPFKNRDFQFQVTFI